MSGWSVGWMFHHRFVSPQKTMDSFVNLEVLGSYCCILLLDMAILEVFLCRNVYRSMSLYYIFWANRVPPTPPKTYSSAVFECPP